ncbi:hypothetical protein DRO32_05210 [Candidatus Bathyarchaeota archaeon]|nr:MAG: hypothetical protein DRO32_05210 [Candidatus Bathyarchaeota archaeon]
MSTVLGVVRYSTRIRDFSVSPREVAVGERVHVSGFLEFYNWTTIPPGWWGLDGHEVEIRADGAVVGRAVTSEGGRFSTYITFGNPGTYTVKAVYKGTFTPFQDWMPSESVEIVVTVLSPEEKKEREERRIEQQKAWGMLLAMTAMTVAVVGAAAVLLRRR